MFTITNETINHAIDYILEHINEGLSVDDVAAHCHFSKYHFSRMFKAETGESIYAFMKRLKLEQSAFRLKVEPKRTVADIGYEFGYSPFNYRVLRLRECPLVPEICQNAIRCFDKRLQLRLYFS